MWWLSQRATCHPRNARYPRDVFVIPHPIYLGDVCYPRVTHVISKFPGMGMRISVRIFVLGFRWPALTKTRKFVNNFKWCRLCYRDSVRMTSVSISDRLASVLMAFVKLFTNQKRTTQVIKLTNHKHEEARENMWPATSEGRKTRDWEQVVINSNRDWFC